MSAIEYARTMRQLRSRAFGQVTENGHRMTEWRANGFASYCVCHDCGQYVEVEAEFIGDTVRIQGYATVTTCPNPW